MTCETITTGRIAEPKMSFTKNGRPVLELNIAATRRTKDKNTNEWTDDGDQLWIRAAFWDQEAERLTDLLHRGDTVTVTGPLILGNFQRKDGTIAVTHEIRFPRFVGYLPKVDQQHNQQTPNAQAAYAAQQQAGWGAPAGGQADDPWGTGQQGAGAYGNAPF